LALVGVVVAVVDLSDHETDQARLPADMEEGWIASEREGGFRTMSYPLAGVSARRIITDPGINSPLALTHNGRKILVTGHFGCTSGEITDQPP
jgi:hypothetical protein